MCFIQEGDWTATIVERSFIASFKTVRCDECQGEIFPGTPFIHEHAQEHEECNRCMEGDCECPPEIVDGEAVSGCCKCAEPDFGESAEYDCCVDCDKMLQGIEAAELEAGCSLSESRPLVGEMVNSICEGGAAEAKKYYKAARRLHPELHTSGYLPRLWRRMFS